MLPFSVAVWKKHSVAPGGKRKVNSVSLFCPNANAKSTLSVRKSSKHTTRRVSLHRSIPLPFINTLEQLFQTARLHCARTLSLPSTLTARALFGLLWTCGDKQPRLKFDSFFDNERVVFLRRVNAQKGSIVCPLGSDVKIQRCVCYQNVYIGFRVIRHVSLFVSYSETLVEVANSGPKKLHIGIHCDLNHHLSKCCTNKWQKNVLQCSVNANNI